MELEQATISILVGSEETTIELHDKKSGTLFCRATLTPEALSKCLSRTAYVECKVVVAGLDNLNKKLVVDKLEFEISKTSYEKKKDNAYDTALIACPPGWEVDNYFGSQTSFFTKDGKNYARATIRKYE